jgi:L-threonylcarbamoyladenylate synthase
MSELVRTGEDAVREAAAMIMKGGIVAYPTDTVFGLGCDPLKAGAVRRLVRAKKRKQGRLPLLVDSVGRAQEVGRFDSTALRLARRFWPGPLTLVIPSRLRLPSMIIEQTGTVGLRMPRHPFALELVRACGGVLVGTSANISGNVSPRTAKEVAYELDGNVDMILDDRRKGSGVESSVVRVEKSVVSILREKSISKELVFSAIATPRRAI